ncbi:MAG: phospholipid carrier-dependent glycosyltransferase, partial [Candidatus Omnitrophica bacterium]|nr:phospholipid carrier-dependent glycosyltransferase [Candidatus Omnitrophota bacterium]
MRWVMLGGFLIVLAFSFQGSRGIWEPDEGYYAEPAKSMISTGDWIVPQNNLRPFIEKPPIVFWGIVAGIKFLGCNEWGVRFANAVWFILTALTVAGLAKSFWDDKTAILSAVVYSTSLFPYAASNIVTPDTPLAFWGTATLACFWKSLHASDRKRSAIWTILMGAALGFGVLSKGPAMLVISLPIPIYLLFTRKIREFCLTPDFFISILLFLGIGSSWYIAIASNIPGAFSYMWDNQISGRFLSEKYSRNPGPLAPFYVYLPTILLGTLPWSAVWYPQASGMWREHGGLRGILNRQMREPNLFLFTWLAFPFMVFCISSSRLPLYLLPLFAPLSIITARCWLVWRPTWFEGHRLRVVIPAVICWSFLIIGLREAVALFPTGKDSRAIWRSMEGRLPRSRHEIVVVNHHRHGLGFYSDENVERVTSSTHPYPTFYMPDRLEEEIHELPTCSHYHVFLTKDKDADMLRSTLRDRKADFEESEIVEKYHLFVVSPAPAEDWVVRLAVLGGLGDGESEEVLIGSALNQVDETRPLDGILLLDGQQAGHDWKTEIPKDFLKPYDALIRNGVEFFSVLGTSQKGGMLERFALPGPVLNMTGRKYYSEVFGDDLVECYFLDSSDLGSGSSQVKWLKQSLRSSKARWKIVAMQAQLDTLPQTEQADGLPISKTLEVILIKNKVRLVLIGDGKPYQRLKPKNGITCFNSGSLEESEA